MALAMDLPFSRVLQDIEIFFGREGGGVKAIVTCPNPAACHQRNFPGIRLGIVVRRAGSHSRGDIPQPWEKRCISVDVE